MGAICPKGKHSKARRDKRRAQSWKIPVMSLVTCPRCGEIMRSHRACRKCGTYNKREVFKVAE
ncbi:MAG: 50S ribosomal protein L32 [Defluviitaleaceae bacterium]|nr:50S ribosomal protein L32 [Defluviitaleaceae bacterium]